MDVAYDHQFQEAVTQPKQTSDSGNDKGKEPEREKESLNDELQQAYKAISNSPWGARFGAFVGTVRKQGESYYETARKEYPAVAEQATKGFTDLKTNLVARTRSLSITGDAAPTTAASDRSGESSNSNAVAAAKAHEESLLEKLRKGASQKIAEIEAAEARADEYLVKFGSSIGGFLRDAITIAPPSSKEDKGEVVFEAKGADDAKKQIFTTRLDAQLHLLHTNHDLFRSDPSVESFKAFTEGFSAEKQTDKVASDLERYPELRSTMEKLVPGEVEYKAFWVRYYFLRNELDLEEKKRKELLQGATIDEEEVGWDEDDSEEEEEEDDDDEDDEDEDDEDEEDDEDDDDKKVPQKKPVAKASTDTLQPTPKVSTSTDRSSQPDSEASYDVVSGAPSKTPSQTTGSPPRSKVS
ncbi:hypothetical protein K440DRAFT_585365 [Wilcoxina mikolae CBS 423.85]|nr:hypothetical protein K440DRAFT_585365 [Wilcoxina mikolae CBS 423.85]